MDWAPPAGTTDSALKALEPKLLSGHIPSDRLVRAPDRSQADRSFARHEASEEPSQARTRRERHFHYECEEPDLSSTLVRFLGVGAIPNHCADHVRKWSPQICRLRPRDVQKLSGVECQRRELILFTG